MTGAWPIPYSPTPTMLPAPPHVLDELPKISTAVKATTVGYNDQEPPKRTRPEKEQLSYVKILFASRFSISEDQQAIAIGIDFDKVPDHHEYAQAKLRIDNEFQALREQAFGPSSYLYTLAVALVTRHDFEAGVCNLDSVIETYEGMAERCMFLKGENIRRLKAARDEHLQRLHKAYDAAFEDATSQYKEAITKTRSDYERKVLRRIRDHYRYLSEEKWTPTSVKSSPEQTPRKKLLYSQMSTSARQKFWEDNYVNDIAVNVLWGTKDIISISHTLENEDYGTLFMPFSFGVIANDIWRFSESVVVENPQIFPAVSSTVKVRAATLMADGNFDKVYDNLSLLRDEYFSGENELPGLEMLSVPIDSAVRSGERKHLHVDDHEHKFVPRKKRA